VRDTITIFLADDNLIAREGVRALLSLEDGFEVVGVAADFDELIEGAERAAPQVVVTDIKMPPKFEREGIDAAKVVRKRHPGTGVVILSQYDDPEYAVSLLREGSAGYAYLLKDRIAEGDQLVRAIREVTTGGSMLDPKIVEGLVEPVTSSEDLTSSEERLLMQVAEGRPIKAVAASEKTTPEAISASVEKLFLKLAEGASRGRSRALDHLKMLHQAIMDREEQGERLSRLLPGGLTDEVLRRGRVPGETETMVVTVLISDVRGYSAIAEAADPRTLARQLSEHRGQMSRAIIEQVGTVMQFVGDAVMGVFGAPVRQEDHADRALRAASAMHYAQRALNDQWEREALPAFEIGIGLSSGEVAAALLGSDERLEYSVVGDSVNLAQRLQQWATAGETVLSEATFEALHDGVTAERLAPARVKGRQAEVVAYRVARNDPVRVVIVDDQEVFRLTARDVVESTDGFEVVGEAETGEVAVDLANTLAPDLVLMDVKMPGIDGLEATRRILREAPGRIVILVLSTQDAGEYEPRTAESGAAAFISKSDFGPDRLAEAWAAARV
jgi:DNA-binding NarL/FixJ family response regulator/class 3 adenylate cyclase